MSVPQDLSEMAELHDMAAHAVELLKAMANEWRLMILCQLSEGEKTVSELQDILGLSQSALSQHLAVLRRERIVRVAERGAIGQLLAVRRRRDQGYENLTRCILRKAGRKKMNITTRNAAAWLLAMGLFAFSGIRAGDERLFHARCRHAVQRHGRHGCRFECRYGRNHVRVQPGARRVCR